MKPLFIAILMAELPKNFDDYFLNQKK